MIIVGDQRFEMLGDRELPRVLSDATLERCWFFACHYGMTATSPGDRRRIKNVEINACKATNNSWLGPVLVEDVTINGLQTRGLCIAWGAVFRHVRIRGRCGRFMLTSPPTTSTPPIVVRQFERDNEAFYEGTDWALDISKGEFEELDIRSVPADLIRRDPETQVVVRIAKVEATQHVWRCLELSGTPWGLALSNMLQWRLESTVLVAPKRRKDVAHWVAGLRLLQKEGIADID
jgi:hypothetical protein